MAEGEGRKTADYLDRLRQRRGKHWHGSCLSLQVVLCHIDLENLGIDEFICREVAPGVRVLRAKFSEITRPSIDRAMATLGQVCALLLIVHWNVGCQYKRTGSAVFLVWA